MPGIKEGMGQPNFRLKMQIWSIFYLVFPTDAEHQFFYLGFPTDAEHTVYFLCQQITHGSDAQHISVYFCNIFAG